MLGAVQWLDRPVYREVSRAIDSLGIVGLKSCRVLKDQLGKLNGCGGGEDSSRVTVLDKEWNAAGMIQMRVREQNGVD